MKMAEFNLLTCIKVTLLTLIVINNLPTTTAHKVLLISMSVKSHMSMFIQLAKALVEQGHDVTMVKGSTFTMPEELNDPHITTETYNTKPHDDNPEVQRAIVQQLFNASISNAIHFGTVTITGLTDDAWALFNDNMLMQTLAEANFDFVVIEPPIVKPYTYVVHKLDVPFAYMGIECLMAQMSLPSMSPSYASSGIQMWFLDEMNVFQRFVDSITYFAIAIAMSMTPSAEKVSKIVPEQPPVSFSDIQRNASLCLRVRESVLDNPRPNLPNVIDVGNLLIKEQAGLPMYIQGFLDNSPDGAILMSLGSVVDKLPDFYLLRIAEAFQNIKYNIIWKSKQKSPINFPKDKLLVLQWAPQIDILAHQNIRCFVSHCGYSSTFESVYYGVPIVGLPVFGDQTGNAKLMEQKGYGKRLDTASLTADELSDAIEEVITGPYANNVRKASAILRDLPSGKEKAVFWIEHVIKHGADHLRSRALKMPLWEYLMLDIAAVAIVWVITLKCACRFCCGRMCICCRKRKSSGKVEKFE